MTATSAATTVTTNSHPNNPSTLCLNGDAIFAQPPAGNSCPDAKLEMASVYRRFKLEMRRDGDEPMQKILGCLALLVAAPAAVLAHHGWGSYDASKAVTVEGPIETSSYTNPHATITVKAADKVWTVTLAPVSRMQVRGATRQLVAVGKTVRAVGYASKVNPGEMRAERITVDGKTVEMR
jgi:hypothetical protein